MNSHPPSLHSGSGFDSGERLVAYLLVAIIALVFISYGVGATAILASAICAAMGFEWFRMATGELDFDEPMIGIALAAAALPPFATFAVGLGGGVAVAMLAAAFLLIMGPKQGQGISSAAFGLLAISVAGACFVWLRSDAQHGIALVVWLIFVVAATEVGYGFLNRDDSPDSDSGLPVKAMGGALASGVIAGLVVAAFYREGNVFLVALVSLLAAMCVLAAGAAFDRVKRWIGGHPSGTLFFGRGTVIETFQGFVPASLFAGLFMLVMAVLFAA